MEAVLRFILCLMVPFSWSSNSKNNQEQNGEAIENKIASVQESKLIDRMAEGIVNWKTHKGTYPWWACGKQDPNPEQRAREWAHYTVLEAKRASEKYQMDLNVWGLLGTFSRESAFDECAMGIGPRKWAYEHRLLKQNKTHITHTRDQLKKVFQNKMFKKKWPGVDLGPGQLMWNRIYRGPLQPLISIDPGIGLVADEMARRGSRYQKLYQFHMKHGAIRRRHAKLKYHDRPWALWPSGRPDKNYEERIVRRARVLGATPKELPFL